MKYTIKYFINKFEAITEKDWCVGELTNYKGQHCVLGHLGLNDYGESDPNKWADEPRNLYEILRARGVSIISINDGNAIHGGNTPKQRILNALYAKLREGAAIK